MNVHSSLNLFIIGTPIHVKTTMCSSQKWQDKENASLLYLFPTLPKPNRRQELPMRAAHWPLFVKNETEPPRSVPPSSLSPPCACNCNHFIGQEHRPSADQAPGSWAELSWALVSVTSPNRQTTMTFKHRWWVSGWAGSVPSQWREKRHKVARVIKNIIIL